MSDRMVEVPESLIETIHNHLVAYNGTTDKTNAGYHLIELYNRVSDLTTWHSQYDQSTATLRIHH